MVDYTLSLDLWQVNLPKIKEGSQSLKIWWDAPSSLILWWAHLPRTKGVHDPLKQGRCTSSLACGTIAGETLLHVHISLMHGQTTLLHVALLNVQTLLHVHPLGCPMQT